MILPLQYPENLPAKRVLSGTVLQKIISSAQKARSLRQLHASVE
jgi:hypothetical protein